MRAQIERLLQRAQPGQSLDLLDDLLALLLPRRGDRRVPRRARAGAAPAGAPAQSANGAILLYRTTRELAPEDLEAIQR